MNLEQFNNQIELVLGNSGNTRMQELRNNPKFVKIQRKYLIGQMRGQNPSVITLIECLVDIESIETSQIGIKQRIANFLADKTLLRKIPFIDRFVAKEQRLLPETTQEQRKDKTTAHAKFENEISGHGKYKNLFIGKPVKNVSLEMNRQKIPEFHSMTDSEKIAQMRKKMDGKSLEDDL